RQELGRTGTISASEPGNNRIAVAPLGGGANAHAASPLPLSRRHRRALVWLLASAMAALGAAGALSAPRDKQAQPDKKKAVAAAHQKRGAAPAAKKPSETARKDPAAVPLPADRPAGADVPPLPPEVAAVKQAIELVRQGKAKDAMALAVSIGDPVAPRLVEWAQLRPLDNEASFNRYAAFIRANPAWPTKSLRRRAEIM